MDALTADYTSPTSSLIIWKSIEEELSKKWELELNMSFCSLFQYLMNMFQAVLEPEKCFDITVGQKRGSTEKLIKWEKLV